MSNNKKARDPEGSRQGGTYGAGKKKAPAAKSEDLEKVKYDLEKTGEALGDVFRGLFKGVARILDTVQDMEKKGESERVYRKSIKGLTKSGKEFRGEAGWRVKTGLPGIPPEKKPRRKASFLRGRQRKEKEE